MLRNVHFTVVSDHANMKQYLSSRYTAGNWHTERWLHEIASFDFELKFESGKSLLAEDILGRVCEYQTDPNMRDDSSLDEQERCFLGQALERRIDQLVLSARDKVTLKEAAEARTSQPIDAADAARALPARPGSTEAWRRIS